MEEQKKENITYDEFKKLDMRVGKILTVEEVPNSEKLLKFSIDFGEESPRTIVSGIKKFTEGVELVGKKVMYIVNLEPRMIMGIESQGMLLAVGGNEKDFSFLIPEESDIPAGAQVR